ncbi:MAG: glycosyl hydrolase family 18 protein, partial [Vicinamibacterales bacterium]
AKGVPRTKLVVGMPFYGRGWSGIDSPGPWNTGTGSIQVGGYRAIAANQLQSSGFVRHWDDVAMVPWLYNADTKEWITYEDAQSMRIKAHYVVEQGLAGAMFWELSNDDGTLLDALLAGLGVGRAR